MTTQEAPRKAGRRLIRTILIILAILLVYALAVQLTEINLEKPLDPSRQQSLDFLVHGVEVHHRELHLTLHGYEERHASGKRDRRRSASR